MTLSLRMSTSGFSVRMRDGQRTRFRALAKALPRARFDRFDRPEAERSARQFRLKLRRQIAEQAHEPVVDSCQLDRVPALVTDKF